MKLKIEDKVILNKEGEFSMKRRWYPKLYQKGVYGVINHFVDTGVSRRVASVDWFNSKTKILNIGIWENQLKLYKPVKKAHNHPLTSIFTDKMPKQPRATKKKPAKKPLTKKKSVLK